jgi:hypothetical protein
LSVSRYSTDQSGRENTIQDEAQHPLWPEIGKVPEPEAYQWIREHLMDTGTPWWKK